MRTGSQRSMVPEILVILWQKFAKKTLFAEILSGVQVVAQLLAFLVALW